MHFCINHKRKTTDDKRWVNKHSLEPQLIRLFSTCFVRFRSARRECSGVQILMCPIGWIKSILARIVVFGNTRPYINKEPFIQKKLLF